MIEFYYSGTLYEFHLLERTFSAQLMEVLTESIYLNVNFYPFI